MNMTKMYQQGALYRLDSLQKIGDQAQRSNQLQSSQNFESEQESQMHRAMQQQKKRHLHKQNIIAVVCGALLCLITTLGGALIVYIYLFENILQQHMPLFRNPQLLLTSKNPGQYFQKYPIYTGKLEYSYFPNQNDEKMGLNTLILSIFWNFHWIQKEKFDFETGNKNLAYLIELATKYHLRVVIRPGPYINSQWDFRGLPARLLTLKNLSIHSQNGLFLEQTSIYFNQLIRILNSYIQGADNPKGPVIMLQIEHCKGELIKQSIYLNKIKDLLKQLGCLLFYNAQQKYFSRDILTGENVIIGVDPRLQTKDEFKTFDRSRAFLLYKFGLNTSNQFSNNHSGQEDYYHIIQNQLINEFNEIMSDKLSFSMVSAGLQLGTDAAYQNSNKRCVYSLLNKQGNPPQNYHIFRSIYANHINNTLEPIPQQIPSMQINFGNARALSSILDNLPKPLQFPSNPHQILPFKAQQLEMYHQGIMVYETILKGPLQHNFSIIVHDHAILYVDRVFVYNLLRQLTTQQTKQMISINCKNKQCTLQIVIEAMGHAYQGQQIFKDRKGLIYFKGINTTSDKKNSMMWRYYKFNLREESQQKNNKECLQSPCLYSIQVELTQAKDTFINIKNSQSEYIWVNRHHIARYNDLGHHEKLYCPGIWLNKGKNKIFFWILVIRMRIS